MFRKHWQVPILLVALICVHYTCPLFCAAFEQKLCGNVSTEILADYAEMGASCCHRTETDAENSSESQSQTECCEIELQLILSNHTYNSDTFRETIEQFYHSVFTPYPKPSPLLIQGKLLHLPVPMKMYSHILNSDISRRGPPYTHS